MHSVYLQQFSRSFQQVSRHFRIGLDLFGYDCSFSFNSCSRNRCQHQLLQGSLQQSALQHLFLLQLLFIHSNQYTHTVCTMNIRSHIISIYSFKFGDTDLFTDAGQFIIDQVSYFSAIDSYIRSILRCSLHCLRLLHQQCFGKSNEICILTYEISFAANANSNTCFIVSCCFCNHHTFFCFTVAAFCRYFCTFFTQPVDCCFKITIGFC